MILTPLLLVFAIAITKTWCKVCQNDVLEIAISQSPDTSGNFDELISRNAKRKTIAATLTINVMTIGRKYQYCAPKIMKEEKPDCRENFEPFCPGISHIEKGFSKQKCPVGPTCAEYSCRGHKSTACKSPYVTEFVGPRVAPSLTKATSLFFDTCVQYWSCTIQEIVARSSLTLDDTIEVHVPKFGMFSWGLSQSSKISQGDSGSFAMIKSEISPLEEVAALRCLKGIKGEICHDNELDTFFPFSDSSSSCLGSACYFSLGEEIREIFSDNLNEGLVANQLDLDSVYRKLQFQNLQTVWDFRQLSHRIERLEAVVSSIIFSPLNGKMDFLGENLLGSYARITSRNRTHISLRVCRLTHDEEEGEGMFLIDRQSSLFVSQGKNGSDALSLFPPVHLELEQLPPPKFKIDSLSYSDIFHLDKSENPPEESIELPEIDVWFVPSYILKAVEILGISGGVLYLIGVLINCRRS